ncbi:hypothetical protein F53441_7352 [Fusarium austroafricanum]|uniref:Uncharacterized protein n=1 Tax=Fusarium austroafricanum TaxID=2364996 RepID=A0A8H4NXQ5_9HYPO|nr:hypothetical protein F53441_7352 [Fusarium austroafricanum]
MVDRGQDDLFLTMPLIVYLKDLDPTTAFNWTRDKDKLLNWNIFENTDHQRCMPCPKPKIKPYHTLALDYGDPDAKMLPGLPSGQQLMGLDPTADAPANHFARMRQDKETGSEEIGDKKTVKWFTTKNQQFVGSLVWNLYDTLGYFLMEIGRP